MANPLQIKNRSQMLELIAWRKYDRIYSKYRKGGYKSETELYFEAYPAMQDLYRDLGRPTMIPRLAWGPPFSRDYNDTMTELYEDLLYLYTENNALTDTLHEGFEQTELDRQSLGNRLRVIEDQLKLITLAIEGKTNSMLFRDSFIDQTHYDKEMAGDFAASVNTRETALTLRKLDGEEQKDQIKITILGGTNGFPGNTHQIKAANGMLKFSGEDNPHMSLADMVDGNTDTWLEYELYEISPEIREAAGGFGFNYHEGISWVRQNNEPLRLEMLIEFPVPKMLNWFSITPFIPADKGVTPAIIKEIIVNDGRGTWQKINSNDEPFSQDKIYMFPRQYCQSIRIKLEQVIAYETWVGHVYYEELESFTPNFLEIGYLNSHKRIDGQRPSLTLIGLQYDPNNRKVIHPTMDENYENPNTVAVIDDLFGVPATSGNIQANIEALTGWRYQIGIKDIAAANYRFSPTSIYISKPFETINPIQSIRLQTKDQIPAEFPSGQWIRYYLSFDDGKTWYPIAPEDTVGRLGKFGYMINSNVPAEARVSDIGYLDIKEPVSSVRLKIELARPTNIQDADYFSPVVYEYTLAVTEVNV